MPKYMDQHSMKPFKPEQFRELQNAPPDEFGVTHQEIIFSEKENKAWCVLDAPNKAAVEKHHAKAKVKTDWIYEIKSTRD